MSKYTAYTIDEIKNQAHRLGMPLDKMRFFPGEDRHDAKCFGIYQDDSGDFIVYKNKADGSRAVRYRGKDEAKACQIFWDKLEDEIRIRQKERDWWKHQQAMASDQEYAKEFQEEITRRKKQKRKTALKRNLSSIAKPVAIAAGIGLASVLAFSYIRQHIPHNGYYTAPTQEVYYHQNGSWYLWNNNNWNLYDYDTDYDTWSTWDYSGYTAPEESTDAYFYDFSDSEYYKEPSSHSSDYDSDYDSDWSDDWDDSWDSSDDYDYDWDDWDSSDTDWDSDW
ncbi:MAG TPA: hypothetical protein DHW39_10530 [Erysipelotrichaceae bacterium]|nr:hypothetical protein [Erysipelotrichaceae bacterium]